MTESFRLKMLNGRKHLSSSYFYLGLLKLKQKEFFSSINLLNSALSAAASGGGSISAGAIQQPLASAYLGAGQFGTALEMFGSAVRSAGDYRLTMLPAEKFRVSGEADMQSLFSAYIEAGIQQFERTGDVAVAKQMLGVAEESRSALFRQNLISGRNLPASYQEKLLQFRQALAISLDPANLEAAKLATSLRLQLADMESELGLENPEVRQQISEKNPGSNPLQLLQKRLTSDEALLSFHTGESGSFVWGVTRTSFEVHRIPAQEALRMHVAAFRRSLGNQSKGLVREGLQVSRMLFGGLSAHAMSRKDWILSLDGPLFDLPFAALPVGGDAGIKYVGEGHSLRSVPTAFISGDYKQGDFQKSEQSLSFIGMADPIYNAADSRFQKGTAEGLQLARLPGTRQEIDNCSRAWGLDPSPVLLTGMEFSEKQMKLQLDRHPAVLHLAAHVLPHPKSADQIMIALGLKHGQQPEYLMPAEIARWRKPVGLVTLSGCSSGTGDAHPGLGLFGLTRAWLLAGASSVVASYWPIPDDEGKLLSGMYERLGMLGGTFTALDVARALQFSQSNMRGEKGWRSHPGYWAGFFVVAKE
ncbi:MAG: CHAT domain-containing protein [Bryobacteraceae bacterium]|nr:CHAT domain-containing protein [Bryobacteraceae bacterium]